MHALKARRVANLVTTALRTLLNAMSIDPNARNQTNQVTIIKEWRVLPRIRESALLMRIQDIGDAGMRGTNTDDLSHETVL